MLPASDLAVAGSSLVLAWASAEVDDNDVLQVKIPRVQPVTASSEPSLVAAIKTALAVACPEMAVRVRFSAKGPSGRLRRASNEWEVWQPGDPDPAMHEVLEQQLRDEVLAHADESIAAVLTRARATSFSRDQVWLAFQDEASKNAVGSTPGAGAALHNTLAQWQGGYTARLYVDPDPVQ